MPDKYRDLQPPRGLSRLAFRAPLWLYRARLGWLLGHRFLRLTHTGRKSGLPRLVVLEVVRFDRATGTCIVAAGFGEESDWLRNVMADPRIFVEVGNRHFDGIAARLSGEEAGEELVNYYHRHPLALRELARFMGYRLDDTEDDVRALGRLIPMFAFRPPLNEQERGP